jgi:hypothetical protein
VNGKKKKRVMSRMGKRKRRRESRGRVRKVILGEGMGRGEKRGGVNVRKVVSVRSEEGGMGEGLWRGGEVGRREMSEGGSMRERESEIK